MINTIEFPVQLGFLDAVMTCDYLRGFRRVSCIAVLGCAILANADEVSPTTTTTADQQALNKELVRPVRIGNSSIWITKYQYDKLMNGGTLPEGVPGVTFRGPITKDDVPVFQRLLAPYLDINYFKMNPKPRWYKPDPYDEGYWVSLDSEGGDVYAAMTIGRMFRKARVYTMLSKGNKCASSCVLLLAGAVNRSIQEGGAVGIHRPYSTDTEAVSFEKLQTRSTQLGVDVSAYLREMNIPSSLYESMKLIPSQNIEILNYSQLIAFGLTDKDPVFAELHDNMQAKLAGVSKTEFLSRKAMSEKCIREGLSQLKPSGSGNDWLADYLAPFKVKRECEQRTIFKDVLDENGNWRGDPADEYCRKLIDATTSALNAGDWRQLLEVATTRERDCANKMTRDELAEELNWQAEAHFELRNPKEAITLSNRCMQVAKIPECHVTKGNALLMLSRRSEGVKEVKLGKRLADQEVSRLRVALQRASSVSERENLESKIAKYKAITDLAQAILALELARPSR